MESGLLGHEVHSSGLCCSPPSPHHFLTLGGWHKSTLICLHRYFAIFLKQKLFNSHFQSYSRVSVLKSKNQFNVDFSIEKQHIMWFKKDILPRNKRHYKRTMCFNRIDDSHNVSLIVFIFSGIAMLFLYTLLDNLTKMTLLHRSILLNVRPFPSIWLNCSSHRALQ